MLRNLDEQGRTTWATYVNVKRMLFRHGLGYAWIANGVGNINTRDSDCCRQALLSSSKAVSYRMYKTSITTEYYLSLNMSYVCK